MITASVISHQYSSECSSIEHAGCSSCVDCTHDGSPHVLLSPLPLIMREPTHGDLDSDLTVIDKGCVYLQTRFIYSNSPVIVTRLEEIKAQASSSVRPEIAFNGDHEATPRPTELDKSLQSSETRPFTPMMANASLSNFATSDLSSGKAALAGREDNRQQLNTDRVAKGDDVENPFDDILGSRTSLESSSEQDIVPLRREARPRRAELLVAMHSAYGRR